MELEACMTTNNNNQSINQTLMSPARSSQLMRAYETRFTKNTLITISKVNEDLDRGTSVHISQYRKQKKRELYRDRQTGIGSSINNVPHLQVGSLDLGSEIIIPSMPEVHSQPQQPTTPRYGTGPKTSHNCY